MPIMASPGVIVPAQFGPVKIILFAFSYRSKYLLTFIMSCAGIPSVIETAYLIPASAASIIPSAAAAAGTKTIVASAPVASTASLTVLKTGLSK